MPTNEPAESETQADSQTPPPPPPWDPVYLFKRTKQPPVPAR
jgi:hypothetical protein